MSAYKDNSIVNLFSHAYMILFGSKIVAHKLNQFAANCNNDIEQLVNLAFSFEYRSKLSKNSFVDIKPLQVKSEITSLCQTVKELNPKTIVEIGTARGGTLFLFTHFVNPDKIISIDLPGGSFGGGYGSQRVHFFKAFGKKHVVQLIRSDSHSEETLAKVKSLLKGRKVDFMFIDGDHTYQGVKRDFQLYLPLMGKGGVIAFHDIVKDTVESGCEVERFWSEIKQNYRYSEIVEDRNRNGFGIGILYV